MILWDTGFNFCFSDCCIECVMKNGDAFWHVIFESKGQDIFIGHALMSNSPAAHNGRRFFVFRTEVGKESGAILPKSGGRGKMTAASKTKTNRK
jgi:hypothetical protein